MKILVVSGFLGAGKTTFIKEMSKQTGRDFVVMENEYAEAGMDRAFLEEEKQINVWELTEGCICCSMKNDFATSILTIANTLDPEYLIVEPTGIGVLSSVMENIRQIEYERITLLSPVTIIDANTFARCMAEYRDIFQDQIAAAGTIVISKRSFADSEEAERFCRRLRDINPEADIRLEHYSKSDTSWWDMLLSTDYHGNVIHGPQNEESDLETLSIHDISLTDPMQLLFILEKLVQVQYGDIFRAKGVVNLSNCCLRFDVVDGMYSITGFEGEERCSGVFIGKHLKRNLLREIFIPNLCFQPTNRIRKRPQKYIFR